MVAMSALRAGGVDARWKPASIVMLLTLVLTLVSSMPMRESEEERNGNYLDEQLAMEAAVGFPWDDIDDTALHRIVQYETMPLLGARVTRRGGSMNFPMAGTSNLRSTRAMRGRENKRQVRFRQCYFNPISCFRK